MMVAVTLTVFLTGQVMAKPIEIQWWHAMGGALAGLAGYHYFAAVPGVYKIARNYGFFGDLAFYGIICGLISLACLGSSAVTLSYSLSSPLGGR